MKSILLVVAFVLGSFAANASETVKGAQKDYENFKKEMNTKLDAAERRIEELKAKAAQNSTEAQEKTIKEVEKTRDELKAKLEEAQKGGESSWKSFKKSFAKSVDKLNGKIQKSLED